MNGCIIDEWMLDEWNEIERWKMEVMSLYAI